MSSGRAASRGLVLPSSVIIPALRSIFEYGEGCLVGMFNVYLVGMFNVYFSIEDKTVFCSGSVATLP